MESKSINTNTNNNSNPDQQLYDSIILPYTLGYCLGNLLLENVDSIKYFKRNLELRDPLKDLFKSITSKTYDKIKLKYTEANLASNKQTNIFEAYLSEFPQNFWIFFSGYFSLCATIVSKHKLLKLTFDKTIYSYFNKHAELSKFTTINVHDHSCMSNTTSRLFNMMTNCYVGSTCINILEKLFQNPYVRTLNAIQFYEYEKLVKLQDLRIPVVEYTKTLSESKPFLQYKHGYDLWCVKCDKIISNKISVYDTGIKLIPLDNPFYYFEIVPKHEVLSKGYILTPFIIESNSESIKITVVKVDDSIPDPELPFCFTTLQIKNSTPYYLEEFKVKKENKLIPKFITDLNTTKYRTGNDEIFKQRYKY